MAYFTMTDSSGGTFVVRIDDKDLVDHARDLLGGAKGSPHLGGVIVKAPSEYNLGWSYTLDQDSLFFFSSTSGRGDVTMNFIQSNLGAVGHQILPGRLWTGSSSTLTSELSLRGGTNGEDRLKGGDSANLILGRGGEDRIDGEGGNDFLSGGRGDDRIGGDDGNDRLSGGSGDDKLQGNDGSDLIFGGLGNDRIDGGEGSDILRGGRGADTFVMADKGGRDMLYGFEDGASGSQDRIDLKDFGLSSLREIDRTASGDDLVLEIGGDSIRLVDYLKHHHFGDFGADDVILA